MSAKLPSRPSGTKRPRRPVSTGSPLSTPMTASYAQKLRSDRTLTYESSAKRAAFWAKEQRRLAQEEQRYMEAEVASISSNSPILNEQFASANITSATLQSAPPSVPSQGPSVAGIGEAGMIPPPPPAL